MRIIAGRLRGRELGKVVDGVRPTTDRVRESLFSSLGDLEGISVLDLFAGTGALGLEAYSRGAERVIFVERSKRVARALRKRLQSFDLAEESRLQIIEAEAQKAVRRLESDPEARFDLVFLDPPYLEGENESHREPTLEALFSGSLLNPRATVVVEGPTRHHLAPLPGIRVLDERRYGDTLLTWLESATDDPE